MNSIQDLDIQGKSVQEIAQELKISRTTVRKYPKHPEAVIPKPHPPRPSKLDPFKEQITKWIKERQADRADLSASSEVALGAIGGKSIGVR